MSASRKKRAKSERPVGEHIFERMDVVHPNAAGIDIGSQTHYVSVPEDRDEQPVRTFGCFTTDLEAMATWLKQCGVTTAAMESTGVYWVPAYQVLTAHGLDVQLVDAQHAKNVPGRKTDVWDSRWLRKLHTFGLLRGCFIPTSDVQELRTYCRHRATLVESCSQYTLRIHKALEQMNVQLHKVLRDVMGQSGMRIIRAILEGERDTRKLAAMVEPGVKATQDMIVKALTGHYRADHLFTLRQALAAYDFLHQQMRECDEQISQCMARFEDSEPQGDPPPPTQPNNPISRRKNEPYTDMKAELTRVFGVDLTRIEGVGTLTAMTVLSECGPDLSSFPSAHHFASWLGLCPNHRITGGRIRSRRTRRVVSRLATALRVAALSVSRSNSALGAFLRRIAARHGMPKAITATAHKLACIIYSMLTRGQQYVQQGQADYEQHYQERRLRAIKKQAADLGFSLLDTATGALVS